MVAEFTDEIEVSESFDASDWRGLAWVGCLSIERGVGVSSYPTYDAKIWKSTWHWSAGCAAASYHVMHQGQKPSSRQKSKKCKVCYLGRYWQSLAVIGSHWQS